MVVWLRMRTVLALMALTAIGSGAAVYFALTEGWWALKTSAPVTADAQDGSLYGLRQEELKKLNKALELIGTRFMLPADRGKLIDGALQGMLSALGDPYSVYMSKEEARQFVESAEGTFTGIGADLKKENGFIVVESPLRDSPAERAGLLPRDVILAVNGESLQGLSLNEAVAKIRGPKGTKAKLKVLRAGHSAPIELELVRDVIPLETVRAKMIPGGIGVITITKFAANTAERFEQELMAMEAGDLAALVIDVRGNPGGMTESVKKVADLLIPRGRMIVQYEYGNGRKVREVSDGPLTSEKSYPIVVLINEGSASSAEILAGALRQSAGAVLVGETTYGKGTVQISYSEELGDGSLVKLTVYRWLLPDGTWVHNRGIEPDLSVTQPDYWTAYKMPRDRVLRKDQTGEDVRNLQLILEGVGFPADRKDGYFSEATESAVKEFQEREGLPVTGEVDAETAERLEEALFSELQKPENDRQLQAALEKARELAGLADGAADE